ncbi:MAG TPA: DUF885 family protein, partial [Kineosporiaceae bacterium]
MAEQLTPRALSDEYVDSLVALDPVVATELGLPEGADRFGDLSPAGLAARADLRATTLRRLDAIEKSPAELAGDERRCARLLRERLEAEQALAEAGDELRTLNILFSPVQQARLVFTMMPAGTDDDWAVIARRVAAVPGMLEGYVATLSEGRRRRLPVGPAQVDAVIAQLGQWLAADGGRGWYHHFVAAGPEALRHDLEAAAEAADTAIADLRRWLADEYAPF